MNITIGARSEKIIEAYKLRKDVFYEQTVEQNNQRLNGVDTFADLKKEIKFIESVLLVGINNAKV